MRQKLSPNNIQIAKCVNEFYIQINCKKKPMISTVSIPLTGGRNNILKWVCFFSQFWPIDILIVEKFFWKLRQFSGNFLFLPVI